MFRNFQHCRALKEWYIVWCCALSKRCLWEGGYVLVWFCTASSESNFSLGYVSAVHTRTDPLHLADSNTLTPSRFSLSKHTHTHTHCSSVVQGIGSLVSQLRGPEFDSRKEWGRMGNEWMPGVSLEVCVPRFPGVRVRRGLDVRLRPCLAFWQYPASRSFRILEAADCGSSTRPDRSE